jgi:hypothetical protein
MRIAYIFVILSTLAILACLSPAVAETRTAYGQEPAAKEMAAGLLDDVFEPFFEDDAFPLQSLIALHPNDELHTYRGRCVSLRVFGADLTTRCERRLAESFTGDQSVIFWVGLGQDAIGLGTVPPLDPPEKGVLRYFVGKVYRIQQGALKSEPAMGTCRMDAFYVRCHTIGKSGRIDIDFATPGGPSTAQYPLDEAFFRYRNAVVFTAPGQCVRLYEPDGDGTAYCASFVGRTLADGKATITVFTKDGGLTYGLYGTTDAAMPGPDGSTITPITYLIRVKRDRSGTAPVTGQCRDKAEANGRVSVDCQIKTVREGAALEFSFETTGPWRETKPLGWQRTGGAENRRCEACPRQLPLNAGSKL